MDNMLFDTSLSNIFLNMSPQARETKAKINKWDLFKLKRFCIVKEIIKNKMNKQLTEWEKIFANDMLNRGLIPKIYINSVSNKQSQLKNEKG